jgi:hypothetical protein
VIDGEVMMRFARRFPVLVALRIVGVFSFMPILPPASAASADDVPSSLNNLAQGEGEPAGSTDEDKTNAGTLANPAGNTHAQDTVCLIVESAAKANGLPLEFFARVIWQESRFQSNAVGPLTHSGRRAEGIAQFMPGTARERRLLDPFDPVQALPKAAEFLRELRNRFGNLGLAAAAYNAGPRRVQEWLAGSGAMPRETRNYVLAITGVSIEDWGRTGKKDETPDVGPKTGCGELIALLNSAPNRFVSQLERRVTRAIIKPWGVQVAAGFGRDPALVMYAKAMKDLSTNVEPRDEPILFRSRGTSSFYQVRIGTSTRRQANELCARIRRTGGACLVKRSDA